MLTDGTPTDRYDRTGNAYAPFSRDYDELIADYGDRIRAERLARNWTRGQFALRSGLSIAQIRKLESGSMHIRNYLIACDALDIEFSCIVSKDYQLPQRVVLTPRQLEVLTEFQKSGTLLDIAERLGTSRNRVGSHLTGIYRRLGVSDVPKGRPRQLAALQEARRLGLLPDPSSPN